MPKFTRLVRDPKDKAFAIWRSPDGTQEQHVERTDNDYFHPTRIPLRPANIPGDWTYKHSYVVASFNNGQTQILEGQYGDVSGYDARNAITQGRELKFIVREGADLIEVILHDSQFTKNAKGEVTTKNDVSLEHKGETLTYRLTNDDLVKL